MVNKTKLFNGKRYTLYKSGIGYKVDANEIAEKQRKNYYFVRIVKRGAYYDIYRRVNPGR